MSFTAKDPNRELWRLEECPDLKHTYAHAQRKGMHIKPVPILSNFHHESKTAECCYKPFSLKGINIRTDMTCQSLKQHVTLLDPQQIALCNEMYRNEFNSFSL